MWLSKRVIFLVLLLVFSGAPFARGQKLVVKNSFVEADVSSDGAGLVTILQQNGDLLTFTNHSFLIVRLNNITYTNNPNSPTLDGSTGFASAVASLTGGVSKIVHGTSSGVDTIRTTWEPLGANNFQLIQDVYPVEFQWCGQIVIRISIQNLSANSASAQAQYLLDLMTSDTLTSHSTDAPSITTRFGTSGHIWQDLSNQAPYFITMEYAFGQQNAPGVVGAGFTTDELAPEPMDLLPPSDLAIVDWATIAQTYAWSYPGARVGTNINADNALLALWPATQIPGFSTQTIASISYGTAPGEMCYGNYGAMILEPEHIFWNGFTYIPSRFPVEGIIWTSSNTPVHGVKATQTVSNTLSGLAGPIAILQPSPTEYVSHSPGSSDSTIPGGGAATATWEDTVLPGYLTNCTFDSAYNITFSVKVNGNDSVVFVGGPCENPIVVDCETKPDTGSGFPRLSIQSRTGSFDSSVCNARCIDAIASDPRACPACGVKSITAIALQNMKLTHLDTTGWSQRFSVCVIDSMQNGSATIVALDGTGESDTATYIYCTIPDTLAPRVFLTGCVDSVGGPCFYHVTDSQAWDRGLDTVYFTDAHNVTISLADSVRGQRDAEFSITGPGGFCMTALDLDGNRFDTCFGARESIMVSSQTRPKLSILPNPAYGTTTISLSGATFANVQIFDVLGREVANFRLTGSYEWNMGSLPAGTYIVRAESAGAVLSKRVIRQ